MVRSRFRQTITLQSPPSGVDARGQLSGSWTTQATKRAEVKQLTGRDLQSAGQLYQGAQYRVSYWYDSAVDVTTKWRVGWGSKTLEIGNVLNVDEQNRITELLCSEVT